MTYKWPHSALCSGYKAKHIEETLIQNSVVHKLITAYMGRMNQADQIITKSIGTCYAVRLVAHNSNTTTLKFTFHCTLQEGRNNFLRSVVQQRRDIYLKTKIVRIMVCAKVENRMQQSI